MISRNYITFSFAFCVLFIVFLLLPLQLFSQETEEELFTEEFDDTLKLEIPAPEQIIEITNIKVLGNSLTEKKIILSYLLLKSKKRYNYKKIETELKEAERRLKFTTFFYQVHASIQMLESDRGVVIIEIDEGFLWRFGGGNAFGVIGKSNLFGKDKEIFLLLGPFYQRVTLADNFLLNTTLFTDLTLDHDNQEATLPEQTNFSNEHTFIQWNFGKRVHPDVKVGILTKYSHVNYTAENKNASIGNNFPMVHFFGGLFLKYSTRSDYYFPESGHVIKLEAIAETNGDFTTYEAEANKYFSIFPEFLKSTLAIRGIYRSFTGTVPFYYKMSISSPEYFRAGLSSANSLLSQFTLLSTELRFSLIEFPIPPAFQLLNELDVFSDFLLIDNAVYITLGPIVRLHFKSPVFLSLQFSYGFGISSTAGNKSFDKFMFAGKVSF